MINNKPGQHIIIDFYHCNEGKLLNSNMGIAVHLCKDLLTSFGCTILSSNEHAFDEGGYTIIYLLSESHCSIHTRPEHQYCAIDIFSCTYRDDHKINSIIMAFQLLFGSKEYQFQTISRGNHLSYL